MTLLILVLGFSLVCFTAVLFVGAPYLPTLSLQVETALKLSGLKKGDRLIELGCGDGKVLIAAAKKGINVVGYELNPILVVVCWLRTIRYRKNVRIIWGDFWQKDWPESDAIFTFLLQKYMQKLDTKIEQYPFKPVKLVSFAFKIDAKPIDSEKDGVFLYKYK